MGGSEMECKFWCHKLERPGKSGCPVLRISAGGQSCGSAADYIFIWMQFLAEDPSGHGKARVTAGVQPGLVGGV